MDCYNCKYKGSNFPGSSHHISCNIFKEICKDKPDDATTLEWLYVANRFELVIDKKPAIKRNPHGIQNGWCDFPIQFDPCWIDECVFYKDIKQ